MLRSRLFPSGMRLSSAEGQRWKQRQKGSSSNISGLRCRRPNKGKGLGFKRKASSDPAPALVALQRPRLPDQKSIWISIKQMSNEIITVNGGGGRGNPNEQL